MAKKRVVNRSIAGRGDFPGKATYTELMQKKLDTGKMTPKRLKRAREILRYEAELKKATAEEHIRDIKMRPISGLIRSLPKEIQTPAVVRIIKPTKIKDCLEGITTLAEYLGKKKGLKPSSPKRKKVVAVLEKILLSNLSPQVNEMVFKIISERNLTECTPLLDWIAGQKLVEGAFKKRAARLAQKLRTPKR